MAELSSLAMVTSMVLYIAAMLAHAAEWASARDTVAAPATPATALVGSGAPVAQPTINELASPAAAAASGRVDRFGRIGVALTVVGALAHAVGVVGRGLAADRLPWGNMYEFITATLLFVVVAHLGYLAFKRSGWLGLPVTLLLAIGQGVAITVYVDVAPLVPALHSVWFIIHIVTAAISLAVFNLGALASILFLVRSRAEAKGTLSGYLRRLPSLPALDKFSYRMHAFAFPLWTFTIAAGSVWAEYAWGRYWGWDPKETWSLVTWVVYAAYLHARATAGWKGQRAAWLAVVGVITFWFNFVGINLLFSGLHSYAGI